MKRFFLIIGPILLGFLVFFGFLFFLSKNTTGTGALQITSLPQSQVYLNGKLLGKTPLCKCEGKDMIATGAYTLKLVPTVGDNIIPYEEHIVITKGVLTVVDRVFGTGEFSTGSVITLIPLAKKDAVQLFVTSFPSDATVTLDSNESGKTPLLIPSTTDSDHEVKLSKSGYADKVVHIHAVMGYQLNALITLGLLSSDATAAAGLQLVSPTPLVKTKITILDTPTGFLRVRSDPSLGASETAQVKPGDTFDYLNEQDGWYQIQLPSGQSGWVNSQYAQKK